MAEPEHTLTEWTRPQGCLLFDPGALRFSKSISRQTLHTNRLLIPRSFARKHGEELSDLVTFQVPGTSSWTVEVSKRGYNDGRLWFHNEGFRDFINFYSLAPDYILVFQYDGASLFSVFIFNSYGSEIQYPLLDEAAGAEKKFHTETQRKRSRSDSYSPKRHHATAAVGGSSRIDHHHGGSSSSRAPAHSDRLVSPLSRSRVPSSNRNQLFREGRTGVQETRARAPPRESERKIALSSRWTDNSSGKQWSKDRSSWKNWKPSSGAPKMAKNPSFKVTLGKQSEHPSITIPSSFSESCFKENPEMLKLEVGDKSWMVKASKSNGRSYRIRGGWLDFARENAVKEGDVCCFELMEKDDIVLKVSICNTLLAAKKMIA